MGPAATSVPVINSANNKIESFPGHDSATSCAGMVHRRQLLAAEIYDLR